MEWLCMMYATDKTLKTNKNPKTRGIKFFFTVFVVSYNTPQSYEWLHQKSLFLAQITKI